MHTYIVFYRKTRCKMDWKVQVQFLRGPYIYIHIWGERERDRMMGAKAIRHRKDKQVAHVTRCVKKHIRLQVYT